MLKVGDVLWIFYGNDYFVGEISDLSVANIGGDRYYFISINGIIGTDQQIFVPATADFNILVEIRHYLVPTYYTVSESVAINYIRDHFNETDNQRNLQ